MGEQTEETIRVTLSQANTDAASKEVSSDKQGLATLITSGSLEVLWELNGVHDCEELLELSNALLQFADS